MRRNTPSSERPSGSADGARTIPFACRSSMKAKDSFWRARAHLRQVLPCPQARYGARRYRSRTRDFARFCGSHGRDDHCRQQNRQKRGGVHHCIARSETGESWCRSMSAAPLKVLVIDDEPPIRKLLRMGLSTQGEILEAPNGKSALKLVEQKPDLII